MISEEEIDSKLLENVTDDWRKVAFVIGLTMMRLDDEQRQGRNDTYFHRRLILLAEKGLLDYRGDLSQMRECEIRSLVS